MPRLTRENTELAREIVSRYPRPRSALVPLLHLAQEQDGYVTDDAIPVLLPCPINLEKYRDVVLARAGSSEIETAARLGISVANVKVRAHRARKQLRDIIVADEPLANAG